jgi:hypothetical protein
VSARQGRDGRAYVRRAVLRHGCCAAKIRRQEIRGHSQTRNARRTSQRVACRQSIRARRLAFA